MLTRLRNSFAAKLLAGGLSLILVVIGGVSAYLLVSRERQTTGAAESTVDNRAAVLAQMVVRFNGGQSLSAAQGLAGQQALIAALSDPADADAAVRRLFTGSVPITLPGEALIVVDRNGQLAFGAPGTSGLSGTLALPGSVLTTLRGGGVCPSELEPGIATSCGLEIIAGSPAYDVAVPVVSAGRIVGAVAFLAPVPRQLSRYQALIQFPVAFVSAGGPDQLIRFSGGRTTSDTPAALAAEVRLGRQVAAHQVYAGPGGGEVAGSFLPILGPDNRIAGWIGVEAPISAFTGDSRTDQVTVALIALLALILTALAVTAFVTATVRRPIARLERGVARIAGGDYTSAIPVNSGDELGRLAESVNRMRDRINDYVSEIETSRARLDRAVTRLSDVSQALTGTTLGVAELEREVVAAAATMGGRQATAWIAVRDGGSLVVHATHAPDGVAAPEPLGEEAVARLIAGDVVAVAAGGDETQSLLAVPMFYSGEVVGALAVTAPASMQLALEQDVLAVLANNAVIARENARLFEQERETVRRLRELDGMKSDFLATIQHELRTPLTAILGLADLLQMCWTTWEDGPKLEAVTDIQVAAMNLHDIVETIIDFAALGGESLGLDPRPVRLRSAVADALAAVAERYRRGIEMPVRLGIDEATVVFADAERLGRVVRAVIDNAVKFSDSQGVLDISTCPGADGLVCLSITDQGAGIPEDHLTRIVDRFYQVDNTRTRRHGGTGMGLALVHRVVTAHGGRVRIESSVGKGTTVFLEWPSGPRESGGEARRVAENRGDMAGATPDPSRPALPVQ